MATQSKANIAVSNDCTSGVFTPNVIVTINGVARTSAIRRNTLRVTLNRNEEPDTADVIVNRSGGFTPTAGQSFSVGLGDSLNYLFAGQIVTVSHVRSRSSDTPDYNLHCVDWTRLFSRRHITADFSGQSATTIAQTIVADYTSGFFSYAIEPSLATIDEFPCVNDPPMAALARLAGMLGGGCYVDANKIVHLWDSSGPSSAYRPSAPATLTNSLATLEWFAPEYDYSQVRTRLIVEGRQGETLVKIPAGANLLDYGIPMAEGAWAFNPAVDADANYARIGTMVVSYQQTQQHVGPPALVTAVDANPGDAVVEVVSYGDFATGGGPVASWAHDADGNFFAFVGAAVPPPYQLINIPTSGYGSIPIVIPAGSPLYQSHCLEVVTVTAPTSEVEQDIEVGEPIIVRVEVDDTAAQAVIAAIEGGDGIHEHVVADSDLSYVGAQTRADAELATFAETLVRGKWVTHDPQAMPGAQQVLNLSSPDVVTGTLTIDSVVVEFLVDVNQSASVAAPCASTLWPQRTVEGSTVKLETLLEAIKG